MISFSLRDIALVLGAQHIGKDSIIHTVSIHSRKIEEQCMFVALIGKRYDGHNFILQAIASGAKALLVNHRLLLDSDIPQLIVSDTHNALIKLAFWIRRQTSAKIILITGSSGKTTVKEMTAAILGNCGKVIATYKNFNNTIGVPITLLRLTAKENFAVIELGASFPGEISKMSKFFYADAAIVNNVYPSHLLGFGSLCMVGKEKGNIFLGLSNRGRGIINSDNNTLLLWNALLKKKKIWKFSLYKTNNMDFFAKNILIDKLGTRFNLHTPYGMSSIFLSMLGKYNIANALAASALAMSVGADLSDVILGLKFFKALPGRLFPIFLDKGRILLDDTYNSNFGSMSAAVRILSSISGYRVLIMSDMLELGTLQEIEYHCAIGRLIINTNINQVLTIGDLSYFVFKICGKIGKHFYNKNQLIDYVKKILLQYESITILVKGSREFQMEQIIYAIQHR